MNKGYFLIDHSLSIVDYSFEYKCLRSSESGFVLFFVSADLRTSQIIGDTGKLFLFRGEEQFWAGSSVFKDQRDCLNADCAGSADFLSKLLDEIGFFVPIIGFENL